MTIATTSDTTRIFIDRSSLDAAMTPTDLHNHFLQQNLNTEVFRMAGRVGIDCLTIELIEVSTLLKELGII
jgi:hypothetical protein